jgi:hypothetical protein
MLNEGFGSLCDMAMDLPLTKWLPLSEHAPVRKGWYQCVKGQGKSRGRGARPAPADVCYRYWNGERFSVAERSLQDERRLQRSKELLIPSWADLCWRGLAEPPRSRSSP